MLPSQLQNGPQDALPVDAGAVASWLQRVMKRWPMCRAQQKTLRHIETLSFGAKRSVILIECDGQRFLLTEGMSAPVPLTRRFAAEARQ